MTQSADADRTALGFAGRGLSVDSIPRVTGGRAGILGHRDRVAVHVHHRCGLDAQRRIDLLVGVGSRRNYCGQERCNKERRGGDPYRAPKRASGGESSGVTRRVTPSVTGHCLYRA